MSASTSSRSTKPSPPWRSHRCETSASTTTSSTSTAARSRSDIPSACPAPASCSPSSTSSAVAAEGLGAAALCGGGERRRCTHPHPVTDLIAEGRDDSVAATRYRAALDLALVAGQVAFGAVAHSLGLLADTGHNLTDAAAVLIALIAIRLGRRPPTPSHSYGYHRATILAAVANAVALLVVTVAIMYEAIARLFNPEPVHGEIVVVVGLAAVIVNLGAALALHERRFDLNMRSALLHMSADAVASLGVAAAGLVILLTGGFEWLDPAVSIAIAAMITIEAWRLVRAAVDVLLEATPDDIDLPVLRSAITSVDNVVDVHDLHVWSLSSGIHALSAHVVVGGQPSLEEAEEVGKQVKEAIGKIFAIAHATLELENADSKGNAPDCLPDAQRHVPQ